MARTPEIAKCAELGRVFSSNGVSARPRRAQSKSIGSAGQSADIVSTLKPILSGKYWGCLELRVAIACARSWRAAHNAVDAAMMMHRVARPAVRAREFNPALGGSDLEVSYAPGLQLVNSPDQLQDPFGHPRLALGRLAQLPHRPAHVGLDRRLELHFHAAARTQGLESGKDALQQQGDPAALARAFELGGHRRLDGTA